MPVIVWVIAGVVGGYAALVILNSVAALIIQRARLHDLHVRVAVLRNEYAELQRAMDAGEDVGEVVGVDIVPDDEAEALTARRAA